MKFRRFRSKVNEEKCAQTNELASVKCMEKIPKHFGWQVENIFIVADTSANAKDARWSGTKAEQLFN